MRSVVNILTNTVPISQFNCGLAHSQQLIVDKAIKKVKENPLPQKEGGHGRPLGHKRGMNLILHCLHNIESLCVAVPQ